MKKRKKRITIDEVIASCKTKGELREFLREIEILTDSLSLELIRRVCGKQ